MNEANILQAIRLKASALGMLLFRNNIGAMEDKHGRFIRFGIGGKGGSDLIGGTPVKITPEHIGKVLMVLTCIEVKTDKGKLSPEQENFLKIIKERGGIAFVARSPDDVTSHSTPH